MNDAQVVSFNFIELLQFLTADSKSKWHEVDVPDTGSGNDYGYESDDGKWAAYINVDIFWVSITIQNTGTDEVISWEGDYSNDELLERYVSVIV